jgi:outer membrane protein OmpA-like peptidoglycan-associated protein
VKGAELDPAKAEFHWGAYYALDDAIVRLRAQQLLSPPKGVILNVQDGILQFAGPASLKWVKDLRTRALLIPGIRGVDLTGRFSPERLALEQAETQIQSTIVRFPVASAALSSQERDALRAMAAEVKELLAASETMRAGNLTLQVIGHSDSTGAEATNQTLSQRRADRVASELIQLGIPDDNVKATGVATTEPLRSEDSEENRQYNRSVSFRINSVSP